MSLLIALCSLLVLIFGFVVFFGAPYLPTLSDRTQEALDMLDLKPGQTLLELGSGDGRVLNAAAERGIQAIGYELNPVLVIWTKLKYRKNRKLITVRWGNFWHAKLPVTDGIYVFLLDKYMKKLDTKIVQDLQQRRIAASDSPVRAHRTPGTARLRASNHPGTSSTAAGLGVVKLVSYAFQVPKRKAVKHKNGLYLYLYK